MATNNEQPPKTIDQRLEALTMNLELLSRDVEAMKERMKRADQREREGHRTILAAVEGYLR